MSGFSVLGILNLVAGSRRVVETRNIPFAAGERGKLDVYAPKDAAKGSTPVVVFYYGGSFQFGARNEYRFVGTALARCGITTVIPDYRLYPEVLFPQFVEDGARAVRWVRDNIAELGGDPRRTVLAGHSAGAHIAAMLAYDRHYLAAQGLNPARNICGLVGLSGPYDFLPLRDATLKIIFGPEAVRGASQPINFVTAAAPPALLVASSGDTRVDPGNAPRLAKRIAEVGGRVEVKLYERVTHEGVVGAFSRPFRWIAPTLADTVGFVRSVTSTAALQQDAIA